MCLCARSASTPPLLAGVVGMGVFAWARVSAAPRHFRLGCLGVCVFVCEVCFHPATPGWGGPYRCFCLRSGFGCALPLLAGVLGCVCVSLCTLRFHPGSPGWRVRCRGVCLGSWLGCWVVCVFESALRLYPATPCWGVRCGFVCLDSSFGCAPPLLARVLGCVCVCVCAPLPPPHSWLWWSVCVSMLGLGFRLHPGLLGCGCVCVRARLVPRHSWLGCQVLGIVLRLEFRLWPATPGCAVRVCVSLCARSACTPPLLAGVCGVGVCAWALILAAPRNSWLGRWAVCVLVCAPPFVPCHSWLGCTVWVFCASAQVAAAPCHSWLRCSGVCVFVYALRLYPAPPGWRVRCGCVCLVSALSCAPPLLAGWLGCVCVCVRAPLVPRHSWLQCAVWVCVPGLRSRLRPATPGWAVVVCLCLCACTACTPPLVAGVCGVGVCARSRVSAAPHHFWLGF